ncbi:hypothetical protein [Campylobacter majalis]
MIHILISRLKQTIDAKTITSINLASKINSKSSMQNFYMDAL